MTTFDNLYHCTECGYTGFATGSTPRTTINGHTFTSFPHCPNDCRYPEGSMAEGQPVELLQYDSEDNDIINAGVNDDHEKVMGAFHDFIRSQPRHDLLSATLLAMDVVMGGVA